MRTRQSQNNLPSPSTPPQVNENAAVPVPARTSNMIFENNGQHFQKNGNVFE